MYVNAKMIPGKLLQESGMGENKRGEFKGDIFDTL
jgi:hypothetical protein